MTCRETEWLDVSEHCFCISVHSPDTRLTHVRCCLCGSELEA